MTTAGGTGTLPGFTLEPPPSVAAISAPTANATVSGYVSVSYIVQQPQGLGVDLQDPKLESQWAQRRRANLEFRPMRAQRLEFSGGEFDLVAATEVLEHVPDPDAVLTEMARVERREGDDGEHHQYAEFDHHHDCVDLGRFASAAD